MRNLHNTIDTTRTCSTSGDKTGVAVIPSSSHRQQCQEHFFVNLFGTWNSKRNMGIDIVVKKVKSSPNIIFVPWFSPSHFLWSCYTYHLESMHEGLLRYSPRRFVQRCETTWRFYFHLASPTEKMAQFKPWNALWLLMWSPVPKLHEPLASCGERGWKHVWANTLAFYMQ